MIQELFDHSQQLGMTREQVLQQINDSEPEKDSR